MSDTQDMEALSFEQALAELEAIVTRLETGEGALDDAIAAYERGAKLKQHCQKKLERLGSGEAWTMRDMGCV